MRLPAWLVLCLPVFVSADEPAVLGLDHIPIAVAGLEGATERYHALGFTLKPGRFHANGIRNQHVKFAAGTELELITEPQLTHQVGGHLALGQQFHRDRYAGIFGHRGDGVAAFGLVSVLGGQADVDVLPRAVAGPVRHVQHDAANAGGLVDELGHLAEPPAQSPEYRCSRHGSPYMW